MKIYKIFCICFLCFITYKAEAKFVDVNSFELDNGLQVFVIENHRAPIIESRVFYKVGSLNDGIGKGGIAHLLEHMMFRGTKKVGNDEFNHIIEENGINNNAYTTLDHTTYYGFMGIDKLELMLALEADRMSNLNMKDEDFLKERDVVLQERKQRFESNPSILFYENIDDLLWQGGRLGNPVSGREKEIVNLTKDDAYKFYKKYYKINNAILVLAGDITLEQAKEIVKKHFGNIEAKVFNKIEDNENLKKVDAKLEMRLEGVKEPRYIKYIRLDKGFLSKKEVLALGILEEYLTGDDSSIMYEKLVYKDKKFLSVGVSSSYYPEYGGQVGISVVMTDKKIDVDEIGRIIDEALDFGMNSLSEEKLEEIKNQYLSEAIYLADDIRSVAGFVGVMAINGYDVNEMKNYDMMINDINVNDVKDVYNKIFNNKLSCVVGLLEGNNNEN